MSATQRLLRFGVFELNLDTEELRKSGIVRKLPPQPFKLLAMLAAHAGQMVTREEIQAQLWGEGTHVDFDHGVNKCIKQIRAVLGDNADKPVYIETLPRHGYRFLVPVVSKTIAAPGPKVVQSTSGEWSSRMKAAVFGSAVLPARVTGAAAPEYAIARAEVEPAEALAPAQEKREARLRMLWRWLVIVVAAVLVTLIGAGVYRRLHKPPVLTEKDTIVLADFDNKTGDPVFDDTLKQALSFDLEQSPFLNVLSDARVARTLKLMNRASSARLTEEVAREVCLRSNSKAMLTGSIAKLGSQYVISLKAEDCETGYVMAKAETGAAGKEKVLKALDKAAISLRKKLGESLNSVQKFGTPLEEATTPSLEALQAYSLGDKTWSAKGETAAVAFYKRAVELDPNFALAYSALAVAYANSGQAGLAAENARSAYDLREKVTDRERFVIESFYYILVTGELEKAAQVLELWQQIFPWDVVPHADLGSIYASLGNWERALAEQRKAIDLKGADATDYANLASTYMSLNRLDEAEAVYKQAAARKIEEEGVLATHYRLAFLRDDTALMAKSVAEAADKPGFEDLLLAYQANTAAWHGKLSEARDLTRRAMDSAQHNAAKETAATYQAEAALYEVEWGNRERARADADAALRLAPRRDVQVMAALALSLAGDGTRGEKLAAALDKAFPLDTLVQGYWLPTVRAAIALQRNNPKRAVDQLMLFGTIELGQANGFNVYLCPVYLRGQAYLMLHDGGKAAVEFQKFVDHYGIVVNSPWGALARLGLARAYALQAASDPGEREKARSAYQDFLTLWKDADPDIPIDKEAKAEYAKLSSQ